MKRFTETDKWLDPWFQELALDAKLVWLYVLDRCDNSGIWEPNRRLANFTIGRDIDWPETEAAFLKAGRIEVLEGGKWLVIKFIAFQYGKLSEDCPPHRQILRLVEKHGLVVLNGKATERVSKAFTIGRQSLQDKDKDKDKEADKETVVNKSPKQPGPPTSETADRVRTDAEGIYAAYPRKEGRSDALRAIGKALLVKPAPVLLEAVNAYAAAVALWSEEDRSKYIPHPATWFNKGRYDDDRDFWKRGADALAKPTAKPFSRAENMLPLGLNAHNPTP